MLEAAGVVVFALTGALVAARKRMDPFGFILLAIVTGVGGGTLRDLLLDRRVFWIEAPSDVMLVAAHHDDLAGARACGLQTAYVERPLECGPTNPKDVSPDAANTLHARDLLHLADLLDC